MVTEERSYGCIKSYHKYKQNCLVLIGLDQRERYHRMERNQYQNSIFKTTPRRS